MGIEQKPSEGASCEPAKHSVTAETRHVHATDPIIHN